MILKTTSQLVPGNYWNIEVDGVNGFGVCLEIRSRVMVYAGILNYTSQSTILSLDKYDLIDAAELHIKSIAYHKGQIRGQISVPDFSKYKGQDRTYGFAVPGLIVRKILGRG